MLSSKPITTKIRFTVLAFALACFAVTVSHAQDSTTTSQSSSDKLISKTVSRIVAKLMQDDHLSKRKLDDTMSNRAFDMFIKNLDPTKSYFLQSDIDEFSK